MQIQNPPIYTQMMGMDSMDRCNMKGLEPFAFSLDAVRERKVLKHLVDTSEIIRRPWSVLSKFFS